jgi:hypothetical protein
VDANIDIFEISYVSYIKGLETLETIRRTSGMATLPIGTKKHVISSEAKSSKAYFEAKAGFGKKSLDFLFPFEEINVLKRAVDA